MNKLFKIAAITSVGLMLTGCGAKKLTCSHTSNDSYKGKTTEKVAYEFDKSGKTVTKVTKTQIMEYTDKYVEYMDDSYDKDMKDVYDSAAEECEDYEDVDFVTCKPSLKGNKVSLVITYKLKGLDEDVLEDMRKDEEIDYSLYYDIIEFLDNDYDDIKKDSQEPSSEFSCK